MSDNNEAPRLTPTQRHERSLERQHEERMAALTREAQATNRMGVSRDEDDRYAWNVGLVFGSADSLDETLQAMQRACDVLNRLYPAKAHVVADIGRNAKGDVQPGAKGDPDATIEVFKKLHDEFPLSREQNYKRDMPDEDAVKKARKDAVKRRAATEAKITKAENAEVPF